MSKGSGGDFTKDDLEGWAKGGAGGGEEGGEGGGGDAGGGGDEEGAARGGNPGEVLGRIADALDAGVSDITGTTLSDDEDKAFVKVWDEIEEEAEALSTKIREALQARDDLKEDDEEDDDDKDADADKDAGAGDEDDDDEETED